MPSTESVTGAIPATSPAKRLVADAFAVGAAREDAERVRDAVELWFHTFALAPGIYTPGIARDQGYRLALRVFREQVIWHRYRALRRRSQRFRMAWVRMHCLAKRWLPAVRILHPWPSTRFDARTQGRSPVR